MMLRVRRVLSTTVLARAGRLRWATAARTFSDDINMEVHIANLLRAELNASQVDVQDISGELIFAVMPVCMSCRTL